MIRQIPAKVIGSSNVKACDRVNKNWLSSICISYLLSHASGAASAAVRFLEELKGIMNGTIRNAKIPANNALHIKRLNAFIPKAYLAGSKFR
jgi:hypothetical protein